LCTREEVTKIEPCGLKPATTDLYNDERLMNSRRPERVAGWRHGSHCCLHGQELMRVILPNRNIGGRKPCTHTAYGWLKENKNANLKLKTCKITNLKFVQSWE